MDIYDEIAVTMWDPIDEPEEGLTKDVMAKRARTSFGLEQARAMVERHNEHWKSVRLNPLFSPVEEIFVQGKIEEVVRAALVIARGSMRPDLAWKEALGYVFNADFTARILECGAPKWAFSVFCHRGLVDGVAAGSCAAAEGKHSAEAALKARGLLQSGEGSVNDIRALKKKVFGTIHAPGYRGPEFEVEVLQALIAIGALLNARVGAH